MKNMKKLFNLLLVLVMIIAVPVFAESGTNASPNTSGKITITNAVDGEKYSVYKIFDLESYDTEAKAYSYTISSSSPWYTYITTGAGKAYFTVTAKDGVNYVTWKSVEGEDDADRAKAFAEAALAYAKKNSITATKTDTAADGKAEFTELNLGYYLVDSAAGQLCMLNTTVPSIEIEEKNGIPEVDKVEETVNPGDTETVNSRKVGDVVKYTVTLTSVKDMTNVGFYDTMSTGLDLNDGFTVTLVDGETTTTIAKNDTTGYKVTNPEGYTFELTVADSVVKGVSASAYITVEYSATVNNKAVVNKAETNTAQVVYGESNKPKGDKVTVETYVHEFSLIKSNGQTGDALKYLEGATFKLYTDEDCTKQVYVTEIEEGHYQVSATSTKELITSVSTETGVVIEGLANGTYYLKEIDPPVGYNRLATPVEVKIEVENGKEETISTTPITVVNTTGAVLPSTGGMGTILFVVIGSILALGFGIILITKFRMSKISA